MFHCPLSSDLCWINWCTFSLFYRSGSSLLKITLLSFYAAQHLQRHNCLLAGLDSKQDSRELHRKKRWTIILLFFYDVKHLLVKLMWKALHFWKKLGEDKETSVSVKNNQQYGKKCPKQLTTDASIFLLHCISLKIMCSFQLPPQLPFSFKNGCRTTV